MQRLRRPRPAPACAAADYRSARHRDGAWLAMLILFGEKNITTGRFVAPCCVMTYSKGFHSGCALGPGRGARGPALACWTGLVHRRLQPSRPGGAMRARRRRRLLGPVSCEHSRLFRVRDAPTYTQCGEPLKPVLVGKQGPGAAPQLELTAKPVPSSFSSRGARVSGQPRRVAPAPRATLRSRAPTAVRADAASWFCTWLRAE